MSETTLPPPLRRVDAAEFRRQLIGLSDPGKKLDVMSSVNVREEAIDFVSFLPLLYSGKDRLELWSRICKGISIANQSMRDATVQEWACAILPHIDCEEWVAAVNERWSRFHQTVSESRPPEWHRAFIAYMTRNLASVVPLARQRWDSRPKAPRKDGEE